MPWQNEMCLPCKSKVFPFELPEGYELVAGRGVVLRDGPDAVIFGYGPIMLSEAWRAADLLAQRHGIGLRVVNLPWLNRVDDDWLRETVRGYDRIFTLDNHYVDGGQGEMLAARLAEAGLAAGIELRRLGLTGIPVSAQNDEALRVHGLDAEGIAKVVAAGAAVRTGEGR